jgi:signal transduction histidine kinase
MTMHLNVLILEDRPDDAELMLHALRRAGFDPDWQRVETAADYLAHLQADVDVILADYSLPQFDALRALQLLQERGVDIPFIIVSGTIGEELAVAAMKQGAADYLLKDRLARLGQVVMQALEQKQLREAKRQAEEALRLKNEETTAMSQQLWQAAKLATVGELVASIAHELNNPLATVSLRVESLLTQVPEHDPKRRALEIIEQEVERMGHLVANLLQFSRRSQPQISTVDVCEEIRHTLDLISNHLRNRRIRVVREFAPDVPMMHADRELLRQLFLNLLTNASDAMPQGGTLAINAAADVLEGGAPAVVMDLIDTGVGIAPDALPKVLEPFFTTKPEGQGTGLRLPICRRIVQEHHGTFNIVSDVGQGTTVRIVLPLTDRTNITHLQEIEP